MELSARIGEERFRFQGHAIESERTFGGGAEGEEQRERVRISLDTARAPIELEVSRTAAGSRTQGLYRIDRAHATLRAVVRPETGASIERVLAFDEAAELDFPSPLFSFVTVGRLRLRPGERRDVSVVTMTLPTLLPALERRRYRRLPDVDLATATGDSIVAADYTVEPLEGGPGEHRLQSNLLGLPVRMRRQEGASVREYRLVE